MGPTCQNAYGAPQVGAPGLPQQLRQPREVETEILGCHCHFGGNCACPLLPSLTPLRLLAWVQPWESGSQTQTGWAVNCPQVGFAEF